MDRWLPDWRALGGSTGPETALNHLHAALKALEANGVSALSKLGLVDLTMIETIMAARPPEGTAMALLDYVVGRLQEESLEITEEIDSAVSALQSVRRIRGLLSAPGVSLEQTAALILVGWQCGLDQLDTAGSIQDFWTDAKVRRSQRAGRRLGVPKGAATRHWWHPLAANLLDEMETRSGPRKTMVGEVVEAIRAEAERLKRPPVADRTIRDFDEKRRKAEQNRSA